MDSSWLKSGNFLKIVVETGHSQALDATNSPVGTNLLMQVALLIWIMCIMTKDNFTPCDLLIIRQGCTSKGRKL